MKILLKFIRVSSISAFNCHNPKGVKLLTRLRLCSSLLYEHKFKHSSQDSFNPICNWGKDIETLVHFPIHCPNYQNERSTFLNLIGNIDRNILTKKWFSSYRNTLWRSYSNKITLILYTVKNFVIATEIWCASLLDCIWLFYIINI